MSRYKLVNEETGAAVTAEAFKLEPNAKYIVCVNIAGMSNADSNKYLDGMDAALKAIGAEHYMVVPIFNQCGKVTLVPIP